MLPCYGLAEATLLVSGGHLGRDLSLQQFSPAKEGPVARYRPPAEGAEVVELCPVGTFPRTTTSVALVHPERPEPVGEGEVGRLWVAGESVAAGYWNRPAETAAVFGNKLPGDGRSYLDTGDVAFHAGGQLFIVGRVANKIIVRGQNFHAEEIERLLAEVMPAGCTSVTLLQRPNEDPIWLLVEVVRSKRRDAAFASEVSAVLTKTLIESFGLSPREVRLLPELSLPRTTSGKIQRAKCLDLDLSPAGA
jgi:acyl-CoA synthetase (AMP-forming)/AMP-acid ligase II